MYELVTKSQKLSFGNIEQCGCCGSDNLILQSRLAQKKFKYTEIKCLKCKASLVFGCTTENPDVFYLRKDSNKNLAWQAFHPEQK